MAGIVKAARLPDIADVIGNPDPARPWLDQTALRERAGDSLPAGLTRELWKYTPIAGFLEALGHATVDSPRPRLVNAEQRGIRVVPLSGLDRDDGATIRRVVADHVDAGRHPLADLSLLRAPDGWLIDVTGTPPEPLEIHYPAQGIAPVFLRLAANARLQVVEHLQQSGGLLAQVTHADIGPGAGLDHYRAALETGVAHYSLLNVRLHRDAHYGLNQSYLGGSRRRAEVHVVLDGPGSQAALTGAYLVEGGQHLDQQIVVEHRAGNSISRQRFHGIGAGKGRSVFNGRIHIHRGAPHSDADLSNKNLALHPEADMNTKPELEIYTDDVRCAHGATVGQMSADALFYLTARGIPEAEAQRLLAYGFVRECMDGPLADTAAARFREAVS